LIEKAEEIMLAAVYHGPEDIRVIEVPKPVPGPGEVLVRVKAAVICATDIKMFKGVHSTVDKDKQLIFGHENTGYIDQLGEGVEGYTVGQPVFICPNIGCGKCVHCINGDSVMCKQLKQVGMNINGGFAEYLLVPALAVQQGNLIPIDEELEFPLYCLTEPLACVLRGQKILDIGPNKTVLILGGGPIGMLHLKLAQLKGASRIIISETNLFRREQALKFGADCVVDPRNEDLSGVVIRQTGGNGADVIIATVAVPSALADTFDLAAIQGRICFFAGLPKGQACVDLDVNKIHYKELVITGTSGNTVGNDREALGIIQSGKIDLSEMITGRYALKDIQAAFQAATKAESLKIAVLP
jgi:L-iditol 2-dehydrogenase